MSQVTEEKKSALTKTLAILGFIGIIILIVWLVVKVVALIPSAFSSLASIADSVYNRVNTNSLEVSTENSVVNTGESFTLSWTDLPGNGQYGFSYQCADGVSVDLRTGASGIQTVDCDTAVNLQDLNEVSVLINSEKERFTDVEYQIIYRRDGAEDVVTDAVITVVNPSIPAGTSGTDSDGTAADTDDTAHTAPVSGATDDGKGSKGGTKTPNASYTPTHTNVVKQYVYQLPQSDPNGHVDLQVTHLGVGTVSSNGVFTPQARIDEDMRGAVRFEVKNIGTKTAYSWSYVANLPSDINYESGNQLPLKPNERVTITLGFSGLSRTGLEPLATRVLAADDVNLSNNQYNWVVEVVD